MVSDGVKTLWVVGGTNGHMFFNDVWMFDVETMKWTEITAANAEDGDANAYFRDVVPDKNVPSGSVLLFYFIFFSFLFFSFLFFSFLFYTFIWEYAVRRASDSPHGFGLSFCCMTRTRFLPCANVAG